MSIIKAGLSSAVLKGLSSEEVICQAKAIGVQGIEWSADTHIRHGDLEKAERLMMATLRGGLTISGYGSRYRIGLANDESESGILQNFKEVLDTARWLQAPLIRVWGHRQRPSGLLGRAKLYSQILNIADRSGKLGICLALEPHPKSFISSYLTLLELIERANHPYFKACWAPLPDKRGTGRSLELGSRTALIHCRHLRILGTVEALKAPFVPVFAEVHRQSRETTLDYWLVLDYMGEGKQGDLGAEARVLRSLIEQGPAAPVLTGVRPDSGLKNRAQRQAVQTIPRSVPV